MIKATELRIGNKIKVALSAFDEIVEITDIGEDDTFGTSGYFNGVHGCWRCTQHEAQPIPLTEEWLERMGFDNKGKKTHSDPQIVFDSNVKTGIMEIWDYQDWEHSCVEIPCKFVHQLQNLFFALTGEELTIKP